MADGYVVTHVYTANAMVPIEGAAVAITIQEGDLENLISLQMTNRDGRTPPVAILAPDIDISQAPSDRKAFSTCNIRVEKPEYYTVFIEDVQVFANTTSLQNVQLIPLPEKSDPSQRIEVLKVNSQNL